MIAYDKLVRDRIPEVVAAGGKHCEVRVLADEEYARRLDEKLSEELAEYQATGELEELADLVEVARTIAELRGVGWDGLERVREAKRTERGGFERRLLLMGVEG